MRNPIAASLMVFSLAAWSGLVPTGAQAHQPEAQAARSESPSVVAAPFVTSELAVVSNPRLREVLQQQSAVSANLGQFVGKAQPQMEASIGVPVVIQEQPLEVYRVADAYFLLQEIREQGGQERVGLLFSAWNAGDLTLLPQSPIVMWNQDGQRFQAFPLAAGEVGVRTLPGSSRHGRDLLRDYLEFYQRVSTIRPPMTMQAMPAIPPTELERCIFVGC